MQVGISKGYCDHAMTIKKRKKSTTQSDVARSRRRAQSDHNRAVYGLAIFDWD